VTPLIPSVVLLTRDLKADPADSLLGVWLFIGDIYGRYDLVGDWTNTSTAKDTPSGSGWFRLATDVV